MDLSAFALLAFYILVLLVTVVIAYAGLKMTLKFIGSFWGLKFNGLWWHDESLITNGSIPSKRVYLGLQAILEATGESTEGSEYKEIYDLVNDIYNTGDYFEFHRMENDLADKLFRKANLKLGADYEEFIINNHGTPIPLSTEGKVRHETNNSLFWPSTDEPEAHPPLERRTIGI